MSLALEVAIAAVLIIGAAFALVGSWALARLGRFELRLHGPSKATTMGVGCVLVASALGFAAQGQASGHELLVALFLFVTAPVAAHMLMRAALALALDPGPDRKPGPPPLREPPAAPPAAGTGSPPPPR